MDSGLDGRLDALEAVLDGIGPAAVAVSGGVDSLTLAVLAHRRAPGAAAMFHAVSPAVPPEATERVRAMAEREGWRLALVDAGEFAREDYRANPVNRCYHCKTSLYAAIRAATDAQILSGTNTDDLGEYRPGLDAAREHGVRHPYVEAGISKSDLRAIARRLGLGGIAELPAAPCLSSRIETGIRIEAGTLALVHAAERFAQRLAKPATVRCRVRADAVVLELDRAALDALDARQRDALLAQLRRLFPGAADRRLAPYRSGSAFLLEARAAAV
jgi:uncharacterized protein